MRNYFSSMSLYIYVINYIFYLAGSSDVTRICTGNSDMSSKSIGVIFTEQFFVFCIDMFAGLVHAKRRFAMRKHR